MSKTDAGGVSLLALARQFVADSGCDEDDMDVNLARVELLQEIDAALRSTPVRCDGPVAWTLPNEEQLARFLCEQTGTNPDFESYDTSHPFITKMVRGWEIFAPKARGLLAFLKRNAPPSRSGKKPYSAVVVKDCIELIEAQKARIEELTATLQWIEAHDRMWTSPEYEKGNEVLERANRNIRIRGPYGAAANLALKIPSTHHSSPE